MTNATQILVETKNLEVLLQKIYDGVKVNIESIRNKIKSLVNRMEARIKPLISGMGPQKKTLSIVKT